MKKLILILSLFLAFYASGQDTIYVYQHNSMIRIDDLEDFPIFLTPGQISYRLRGSNFVLKDGLTKQEYTIGSYDEIFNADTVGYSSQEDAIDYLNTILNTATRDVFIQDATTPPFQYYLMYEEKDDIKLAENAYIDSMFVLVDPGHGFTGTGEYIVIMENNIYVQTEVASTSNDTVYLNIRLDNAFTTDAVVLRGLIEMNVDGSVTDSIFRCLMRGNFTIPIDIQTVKLTMQHATAGDKSKFGDLAELTNGLLVRKINSVKYNLGNYKSNQDFDEFGATVVFDDKAGGGNHSTTILFDLKSIYGVVIRLNPRDGDCFRAIVRDDLDGLLRLRIAIIGQYTSGE